MTHAQGNKVARLAGVLLTSVAAAALAPMAQAADAVQCEPEAELDRLKVRNAELEGRQKLWRWLILAAISVLIVETWLAGRIKRPRLAHAEALAT